MNLEGKRAIVTGVSKGIGRATAKLLLSAGVKVAGWSRNSPDLLNENFFFHKTNIAAIEDVNAAYKATVNHWGGTPDILINNAGLGYEGPIDKMPPEQWHEMVNLNINGIFYCSRLAVADFKKKEKGHIINISSIAGNTGIPYMSGYCGTKHAVRGISHAMYKELRNKGIKVTCIYPGSVQTNFFDSINSVEANSNMMQPEDIASTILHCLSSSANYHHVDIEVRPLKPKG
ncbi:MAG: SDR family oxidoreductase [Candidatus Cyclobacteriaceae bacterium M2_1C_046]